MSDVTIRILGNSKDAVKAFKDVDDAAGRTETEVSNRFAGVEQKFSSVGKSMMGLGGMMTAAVTLPLVGIGAMAFQSASTLQDNLGQVGAVYKDSASGIMDWAKTTTEAYGISEQDSLGYAGTLGNIFTAMGFNTSAAGEMSKSIIGLGGDLASFSGTNPEEAITALTSAMSGEFEPMKKYGVLLNEATIKQQAMSMGLWDGVGTMDSATKAQATYAAIMAQTSNQQGDYARTADSANNTMNTTKAKFEDLTATLGEKLLPIGVKIMDFVSGLMTKFEGLDDNTQTIILVVGGLAAVLGPLIIGLGAVATAIGAIGLPVIAVVAAVAALAAGFWWLYNNNETFRNGIQAVWEWIQTTVIPIAQGFFSVLVAGFSAIVGWVQEKWPQFQLGLQRTFDWINTYITPIVVQVVTFVVQKWNELVLWFNQNLPKIQEAISHVWNVISGYISFVVNIITTVISTAWNVITTLTQGWGDNLGGIVSAVWDQIKLVIDTVINVVRNIIEFVMNIINGDWGAAWQNILNIGQAIWDWIQGSIGNLWEVVKNLFGMGIDFIRNLWSTIWTWVSDFIRQKLDEAVATARSLWDGLVGFVSELPGRISSALGGLWDGLVSGFKANLNTIIALWNRLSFTVPSVDVPGLGTVGGQTIDFPDIPYLAKGGTALTSGLAIVGEQGPELVNLDKGASVMPLPVGQSSLSGSDQDEIVRLLQALLKATLERPADVGDITVNAETNANPQQVSREIAWILKTSGR